MRKFDAYISELLNERGINDQDKEDLKYEIMDHLILLKDEYLKKGLSEQEAEKSAIKDFGDSNSVGNNIKINLPSLNKSADFSSKERLSCILQMFLAYSILRYLFGTVTDDFTHVFFYTIMNIGVVLTSFILVNKKLTNEKNKIKNIIICNSTFFISEKIIMFIYAVLWLTIVDRSRLFSNLLKTYNNFYFLNWKYISLFLLLTIFSVLLTKLSGNKLFNNRRNVYNYTAKVITAFVISILLIIPYAMIQFATQYRLGRFRYIVADITGYRVTDIAANTFYTVFDSRFVVPNIGLVILIILIIRLIIQIKKKGIKSIL